MLNQLLAGLVGLLLGFGGGVFYGHLIAARLIKKVQAAEPSKK